MNKKEKPEQRDIFEELRPTDVLNMVKGLADVLAACVWPFTRSGMGTKGLAFVGPLALVLMFVLAGVCPPLELYIPAWLVAVVFQRIRSDPMQHSRYAGFPSLAALIPGVRPEWLAKAVEAFMVIGVGAWLTRASEEFGLFIAGAGVALLVSEAMNRSVMRARVRRMRDAAIEHMNMTSEVHRGRW